MSICRESPVAGSNRRPLLSIGFGRVRGVERDGPGTGLVARKRGIASGHFRVLSRGRLRPVWILLQSEGIDTEDVAVRGAALLVSGHIGHPRGDGRAPRFTWTHHAARRWRP